LQDLENNPMTLKNKQALFGIIGAIVAVVVFELLR
jgi:hypothetical protein